MWTRRSAGSRGCSVPATCCSEGDFWRIQGRLWVTGRKKDVIRSGSENVHAAEVEAVLTSHPGVAAAAAVGIPDNVLGERVACLLQLSPGWMWAAKAVAGPIRPPSDESPPKLSPSLDGNPAHFTRQSDQRRCFLVTAVAGEATELGYLDIGILQRHCRAMGLSRYVRLCFRFVSGGRLRQSTYHRPSCFPSGSDVAAQVQSAS